MNTNKSICYYYKYRACSHRYVLDQKEHLRGLSTGDQACSLRPNYTCLLIVVQQIDNPNKF